MTEQEANVELNKVIQIQEQRHEKYYSWVKSILTLAVGLFGILIAFKTISSEHIYKSIFYVVSISSLGMGILFSLIALYAEINVLEQAKKYQVERLLKLLDGMTAKISDFENINPKWIYRISGKLNIFFFLISVFSLIIYSSFDLIYKLLN
jgi:hypothetical protein